MPLFDRDRYQRLDGGAGAGGGGRRSPSSCSTATIVLFVALCLVGAWMMASSRNVPMSVSSTENKSAAAKENDASIVVTDKVEGGGGGNGSDAPQATEEAAGDAGKKDQDAGDAGKEDQDTGDATKTTDVVGDTGTKDDGDGDGDGGAATQSTDSNRGEASAVVTDAIANTTTGGTEPAESGKPAGDTAPPKNQTFSDENGKTEGGEVVRQEDPDKQSAEEAPTDGKDSGGQDRSNADEAPSTDTKENAGESDKKTEQSTEEETRDTKSTGGQAGQNTDEVSMETKDDKSGDDAPTDAKATGDGGSSSKNQATFDDENGKMDGVEQVTEDGKGTEKSSKQVATNGADDGEVQATDGDTTAGAASNNQTIGDQNDAPKTTTTTFETTEEAPANSTAATDEIKPAELLPSGQAELLNETASAVARNGSFPTQASESSAEKKARESNKNAGGETTSTVTEEEAHDWKLCNSTAGADYIPCLDNEAAIKKLKSTKHYEHRERHCPAAAPTCLVPLPAGYRRPIPWPYSRDKIWYHNVPHTKLASYKGHQNWVKVSGEHLTFPGGGTQFKNGAAHYIDLIEEAVPGVAWGRRSRVVLDVGCGVASFGGFLFDKDALTMSLAPKDEHEAQVQFALERGIPAISAVMGTKRLPFPGGAFDAVHCARCRVPWHIEGGKLLLEVNRLLRSGGLFVWSATPVYRKTPEDVQIWHDMAALTKSMCWEMVKRTSDTVDETAMVIFKKPSRNDCYSERKQLEPPLCDSSDDPDAAWNVTLQSCMPSLPTDTSARGARWPEQWPERLSTAPYWLSNSQVGVYGKPAPDDFAADNEHWSNVFNNSYLAGVGIDWSNVRNVMDMRAVYGGFAAALKDMKVWVMNVVPVDSPDTLPIIYERGLFGMYHDWCESFSTYPRSYDLLHADHLFSKLKNRCKLLPVMVEVDRILRPEGKLIVRDDGETAKEVESIARSLHWEVRMTVAKQGELLLCFEKTTWRPTEVEAATATAS
ncbi:probable methyltransferase PMT24 [Oryza brachyantha]|uniref:probable methyltransferase PMT24 n=1 Tax=Oryza brachyantha TaxID=4533 RepID=UPI001ADA11E7|nr:probable methyltransferase PMT24 [Oryza brachyantha]